MRRAPIAAAPTGDHRGAKFRCHSAAGGIVVSDNILVSFIFLNNQEIYEIFPALREEQFLSIRTAADIAPAKPTRPVDPVDRGVGTFAGGGKILAECGDAEHAAAVGDKPLPIATSPGVEYLYLGVGRRGIETADLAAALGLIGVTLCRHHDAHRVLGVPAQIDRFQHAVASGDQRRQNPPGQSIRSTAV